MKKKINKDVINLLSNIILLILIVICIFLIISVNSYSGLDNSWTLATNEKISNNKLGYYFEFTADVIISFFGLFLANILPWALLFIHIILLFFNKFNWLFWVYSILGIIMIFIGLTIIINTLDNNVYSGIIIYEMVSSIVNNIMIKLIIGITILVFGVYIFFDQFIISTILYIWKLIIIDKNKVNIEYDENIDFNKESIFSIYHYNKNIQNTDKNQITYIKFNKTNLE